MYIKNLLSGNSRKKIDKILLSITNIERISDNEWNVRVIASGLLEPHDRILKAGSEFDALVIGLSFLRQHLRLMLKENKKLKFYEEVYGGELLELSVEEIFWTQDCIPEDMERVYEWAKDKGYQPE